MKADQPRHPTNEVLELYSFGRLSGAELDRTENHLFVCEQCQEELGSVDCSIREIKEACERLTRQPTPARVGLLTRMFSLPAKPVFAGAFAAVALAIIVPVSIYRSGSVEPAVVHLDSLRGPEGGALRAPAKRPLHLQLSMPEGETQSKFRAEIVNQSGSTVWTGFPIRADGNMTMDVDKSLGEGLYWVRLFDQDAPVREFGLELK